MIRRTLIPLLTLVAAGSGGAWVVGLLMGPFHGSVESANRAVVVSIVGGTADLAVFGIASKWGHTTFTAEVRTYRDFCVGPHRHAIRPTSRAFHFDVSLDGRPPLDALKLNAGCPLWLPFLVSAAWPFVAWLRGPVRRRVRRSRGLCAYCAYSLVGNTSGVCPECGRTIDGRSQRRVATFAEANGAAGADGPPLDAAQDHRLPISLRHVAAGLLGLTTAGLFAWLLASRQQPLGQTFVFSNSHSLVAVASQGSIGFIGLSDTTKSTQSWSGRTLADWKKRRWGRGWFNVFFDYRHESYAPNGQVTHRWYVVVLPGWLPLLTLGFLPLATVVRAAYRWRCRTSRERPGQSVDGA